MNKSAGLLEGLWVSPWRSGQFLSVPGGLPEFPGLEPPPEEGEGRAMWTELPRKRWQEDSRGWLLWCSNALAKFSFIVTLSHSATMILSLSQILQWLILS